VNAHDGSGTRTFYWTSFTVVIFSNDAQNYWIYLFGGNLLLGKTEE